MAMQLNIDTTQDESASGTSSTAAAAAASSAAETSGVATELSSGMVEAPIESTSPVMKSTSKMPQVQSVTASRLNRQVNASAMEKNLESVMFELETEDLELLESRVAELEQYLGIENMDMAYF